VHDSIFKMKAQQPRKLHEHMDITTS